MSFYSSDARRRARAVQRFGSALWFSGLWFSALVQLLGTKVVTSISTLALTSTSPAIQSNVDGREAAPQRLLPRRTDPGAWLLHIRCGLVRYQVSRHDRTWRRSG